MNKLYARITGTDLYRLVEVDADGNLKVASSGGGGGGAATVADGADVTQGAIADVKVTGDSSGTVSAKLRGLSYLWAPVVDTVNSWLRVSIQNASLAVTGTFWQATQPVSGTVTAGISAGTNVIGGVRRAGYQNAVWTTSHFPAANTQATITKASAGGGVKNVALGFVVSIVGQSTAPAAVQLTWKLIDGASGGGTILDGGVIALPAVAGANVTVLRSNIYIPGTAATAMTLEFSATGGANTIQSVSLQGTTE